MCQTVMAAKGRPHSQLLATLALAAACYMPAAVAGQWESASLIFDNDFFTLDNKDRYYTNGLHYRLESKAFAESTEENTPSWLLPVARNKQLFPDPNGTRSIAYQFGQLMFTPRDKTTLRPGPGDLPYAGILYGSVDLRQRTSDGQNNWTFLVGVIGPISRADAVQRYMHAQWGIDAPKGWGSQLGNELLLNVMHERRYIIGSGQFNDSFNYRLATNAAFQFGNYDTSAGVGAGVLLTQQPMKTNGGHSSSHADRTHFDTGQLPRGWFMFAGTQVRLNVWTVVVNGTLTQDSGLTPVPFSLQFTDGFGYTFDTWSLGIAWHRETPRFTTQGTPLHYGSIIVNFRF